MLDQVYLEEPEDTNLDISPPIVKLDGKEEEDVEEYGGQAQAVPALLGVSDVYNIEDQHFVHIGYQIQYRIDFNETPYSNRDSLAHKAAKLANLAYAAGLDHMPYNQQKDTLDLLLNLDMLAILDPSDNRWRFTLAGLSQPYILDKMAPQEVLDQFQEHVIIKH